MHPMTLASLVIAFHNEKPLSLDSQIGIQDLKVIEVVNKFFNEDGTKGYDCKFTFRGNVIISCTISAKLVTGLIFSKKCMAQIINLPASERGFNLISYPNHDKIDTEGWVAKLYRENANI